MPRSAQRWTLVAAILGLAITITDQTVVYLALPAIERDLGFGLAGQQWVVSAYLVPLAGLLLLGGALADRHGRRRLFVSGAVAFGLASIAAALAPSATVLFAARAVQGVAAAALMPATLALVSGAYSGEARGGAIGAWAAWSGIGSALGPVIAGVLVDALSWRWVFAINVPFVVIAVAIAVTRVPEQRDPDLRGSPADVGGAFLGAATLGAIAFVLVQGPALGWTHPAVLGAAVLVVIGAASFVVREQRAPHPVLPLSVFRSRAFSAANAVTLALYASLAGVFFLVMIHLQTVMGYPALAAGLASLPVTAMMLLLSSFFGRLGTRVGPRPLMSLGPLVFTAGTILLAALVPGHGYLTHVLPGMTLLGLGLAVTVAPLTTTVMSAVSERRAGLASGVNNAVARTAGLLGVAVGGMVFGAVFRAMLMGEVPADPPPSLAQEIAAVLARPTTALELDLSREARRVLRPLLEAATLTSYRGAMGAMALLAVLAGLAARLGLPRRGQ
ncbi:MAG: DHA2 family efflux MFS transporter permease subunit [Myxococcota bacterium]